MSEVVTDDQSPCLMVRLAAQEEYSVLSLTVEPIVEVPSGTSGPWLRLRDPHEISLGGVAMDALEQAMAADVLAGFLETEDTAGLPARSRWYLSNTQLITPDGQALYLSPKGVCWCADDGTPAYECDEWLRPAESMLDPAERMMAGYRFVADERVG